VNGNIETEAAVKPKLGPVTDKDGTVIPGLFCYDHLERNPEAERKILDAVIAEAKHIQLERIEGLQTT
jgi:hypothetical protein